MLEEARQQLLESLLGPQQAPRTLTEQETRSDLKDDSLFSAHAPQTREYPFLAEEIITRTRRVKATRG